MRIEIDREDDGRWIAEVSDLEGVLAYGESREQVVAKVESLGAFASSPTVWITASRFLNWTTFSQCPYERMVFEQSPASARGIVAYWLVGQETVRHVPSRARPARLARLCLCLSRQR